MQALPEHQQLIAYIRSGKAVCFEHRQQYCFVCCVDFRDLSELAGDGMDDELGDELDDELDENTEDD